MKQYWLTIAAFLGFAIMGFAIGRFTTPTVPNEAGLIGIIATQQGEIGLLKALVETYESERDEIKDADDSRAL